MTHDNGSESRQSRRAVLRALGVGAGASMVGGRAVARTNEPRVVSGDEDDGSHRPTTGTVHDVEMQVSGPATHPDRPADFHFEPTGLNVASGDVLRFIATTPDHNVVSYHPAFGMRRRVPLGVAAFSSPLLGWHPASIPGYQTDPPAEGAAAGDDENDSDPVPQTWLHGFDVPGVYDLLCSPHEAFGMVMRVVVGDVASAPFETDNPDALAPPRVGPIGLARVTLTDPALQPSAVVDAGTVGWTDLDAVRDGGG